MAFIGFDNDCAGCETCRSCGRDIEYPVYECDGCGEQYIGDEDLLETRNGLQLCEKCFAIYEKTNEDRKSYIAGYEQALKDLLTIEDGADIDEFAKKLLSAKKKELGEKDGD